MGINRRCRFPTVFKGKVDPVLCCVICGAEIPLYELGEVFKEREDWERLVMKDRKKSVIVPAEELEKTDFVKYPHAWSFFVRAILDDPKTSQMSLSGISHGSPMLKPWELPIPRDPRRAFIKNLALDENHWNADFHMVNLFKRDKNRQAGERIGYPIHPHCWLLLERFVGHDLIMSNLRPFVRAIKEFWKRNKKHWDIFLDHVSVDGVRYEDWTSSTTCTHWLKEPRTYTSAEDREHLAMLAMHPEFREWHTPGSSFRIPDIQRLITQNIQSEKDNSRQGQCGIQSQVFCLPLDIAMTLVDIIYESQPHCQRRIDDIRNLLEAFRWKLPDTYWQARCNRELLFELDDLIKAGTAVNWSGLCLGIEELLVDDNWYCNSGLENRARTLKLLGGIKENFLHLLKGVIGQ